MASITKRENGDGGARYDVRHRVGGRQVTKTFRRRKDADAYRREVEHAEMVGLSVDPRGGRITLDEWWTLWWPTVLDLRPSSRARDESYYRSRISPTLGPLTLDRIDRATLRSWVVELEKAGLAPATIHRAVQIVSKLLRTAVEDGRLARNAAERLPVPRVERHEMRYLTPEETAVLADTIDDRYRALVLVAAYGGLRIGEMFALERDAVNILKGTIDVHQTVGEVRGVHIVGPPKTRAGRRTVPIPRMVAEELGAHLGTVTGDLVFPAPEGGYVRSSLWRRRFWHPAVAESGLAPLRPHDLRHSAVAFWIAAGASPKEIAVRAGHSSVVTVLDRYGHLLPGTGEKVTDALDAMARGAATP